MSRSIVLSNGELAIALDRFAEVRDFYYPHVGLEDHARGHYIHHIGVWVDGQIAWFSEDPAWEISISCEEHSLASSIVAKHKRLQLEVTFKDIVYNERPVFVRRVTIANLSDRTREIKIFFGHQFEIYKAHGGDTAYFDPLSHTLIHYKGRRVFLIGATLDGEPFTDFATGKAHFQGSEGTHRDADDGVLSKNPIEHGPADSVLGVYGTYTGMQSRTCYYWVAAAKSIPEVLELNQYVVQKTPEHILRSTSDFWRAWVNAYQWNFHQLSSEHIALFKRSLMYMRAHVDTGGGVIASLDSDMLQHGLDTYTYVWPRDAAYVALSLDLAGDTNVSKRFFEFCNSILSSEGYFMHKYLPDRSLGSSWHPWILNGQFQLPIQEDETALVIYALHNHYTHSHDLEFLEELYNPLVERASNFMVQYRDSQTKLPAPSYDVWEEKRGSHTYTASAVFGALNAAAELSKILGKEANERRYREAAREIQDGIIKHLWDEKEGIFIKSLNRRERDFTYDRTVDISSVYGVFAFGVLPQGDARLARAFDTTVRKLSYGNETGGLARYEGDDYYRVSAQSAGNPWVVTTLWYAEYLIAKAKNEQDFDRVREVFTWAAKHALPSGVLAEQMNPQTGEQVSASPLTWSHAAYVSAVLKYLERLEELGICVACNPAP
ncbi:MAG: Glycoside hydrolase [Candidatus Kaiserbacteria bacterium GW2011_GWB1_52_6]|uniref:Glycoside hydrolase n=3 Tax=Candidatus Kaiseribacteriota TaxID=1752734 RepID=A0A0G2AH59_9BACT|nr:MAG: Glycoside hydrolase [Candidatus Kaiserbacteria bacterium GW2011_GWA2_52_12]KKW26602.1 MAG: Glycoside hydrolase [Candidatus Kaiserbacteria bacterium GW2011_GWB1_52_6]KKW31899.1 MAG: Glycoside hydrolase [Candidatus Kaiserbacteria bacterium GW2011_GWC2_52_8b]